jgi:hypothetical protein
MSTATRKDNHRMIAERCWMLARLNAENRAAVLRRVTRDVFRMRGGWSSTGRKPVTGLGVDDRHQDPYVN